jgi:fucose 4-O-acetylase-like acetyltransferase
VTGEAGDLSVKGPPPARIPWVDVLRGLGILIVVFGHQKPNPKLMEWLQVVMAPVFFFSSGFLFDPEKFTSFGDFLKRRGRAIVIPYFAFSYISLAFWVLFAGGAMAINEQLNAGVFAALILLAFGTFYGTAMGVAHNIPLWFLTCLFSIDNIFYLTARWRKRMRGQIILLTGLAMFGYLYGQGVFFRLPWNADIAMSLAIYYGAGYWFRRKWGAGPQWHPALTALAAAAFLAASVGVFHFLHNVHPMNNQLDRFIPFHACAGLAVGFFLLLSQLLSWVKPLHWVGRNAIVLLGVHVMTMSLTMTFCEQALGVKVLEKTGDTLWALVFFTGAFTLSLPLVYVVNRWLPWILGKRKPRAVAVPTGE